MEQGSFESLIKEKMESAHHVKAPKGVWVGIASALSDKAIIGLQSSHAKYKWVAAASVLIAAVSLALNFDPKLAREEVSKTTSYNALLPSTSDHFRFYDLENTPNGPSDFQYLWSNVLFIKTESKDKIDPIVHELAFEQGKLSIVETNEIIPLVPSVEHADVHSEINPYYLAHSRRSVKKKTSTSFWAGVEAGAGSFNPEYTGSNPIAANVDFDALANSIGQSGFVNPSSYALQNGMNEGITTSLGVDFGMKIGKKWTLESGVQYTSIENQSKASVNIVDVYSVSAVNSSVNGLSKGIAGGQAAAREVIIEDNFDHSINLDNSMRFTSIPLKAGYYVVDNKLSLRLNAGLAANYFLASNLSDPLGQLQSAEQVNGFNEWSFDGLTGFELGYNVFNNFNLTLEPNYRRSITPLSDNVNNRSGFMVQTGFRYTIK